MYNGKITILVLQSPSYKVLLTKGHPSYQDIFQMCQDSNILVNCPPPSRETTPLIRTFFHCWRGGLIRGGILYQEILVFMKNIVPTLSQGRRSIVVMVVWWLDLQLLVQSVPITTKVFNTNPAHDQVYSTKHYVIKFVSDLRQVVGFLVPPPIKLTMTI